VNLALADPYALSLDLTRGIVAPRMLYLPVHGRERVDSPHGAFVDAAALYILAVAIVPSQLAHGTSIPDTARCAETCLAQGGISRVG
jgi:hypothetical protein